MTEELTLEQSLGQTTQVDGNEWLLRSGRGRMEPQGDELLPGTVLAGDEHICIRWSDALHQLENRLHLRRVGNQSWEIVPAQHTILILQPASAAQRTAELDLGSKNRHQPRIVPWLLDVVAGSPSHRLDGALDAAPGGHDDDRQIGFEAAELLENIETLLSRCRIAHVVHVEQQRVVVALFERGQHGARRAGGIRIVAVRLEEQARTWGRDRISVGDMYRSRSLRGRTSARRRLQSR